MNFLSLIFIKITEATIQLEHAASIKLRIILRLPRDKNKVRVGFYTTTKTRRKVNLQVGFAPCVLKPVHPSVTYISIRILKHHNS